MKVIGSGVSPSEIRAGCQFLCLKPLVSPYCLRIKCKPFPWSAIHALASEVKSKAMACKSCVCHALVPFWVFACSGTQFVEWIMPSKLKLFQFFRAVVGGLLGNRQVGSAAGGLTPSRIASPLSRVSWRLSTPLLSRHFCPQDCFHWVWNLIFVGPSLGSASGHPAFSLLRHSPWWGISSCFLVWERQEAQTSSTSPLWFQA